jgi:hypothetical protein
MPINSRAKGQRAERDVANRLNVVVERVCLRLGVDFQKLKRNLAQTQQGGFDLEGVDWIAIEVKHQAKPLMNSWWEQTLRQAGPKPQDTATGVLHTSPQGGSPTSLQGGAGHHYRGVGGLYRREPVLIWKITGGQWRVRMFGRLEIEPGRRLRVVTDISMDDFLAWFERRLEVEIKNALSGAIGGDKGLFD